MRCLFGYIYLGKSVGRKLVFPCCTSNLILVNEAKRGGKARLTPYTAELNCC